MALDMESMLQMQRALQERYKTRWEPVDPAHGRNKLLWMLAEIGEVTQIIKRHRDEDIMTDAEVRSAFIEELCDVLMYFSDVCLCYDVTPEELEAIYRRKHEHNMTRWLKVYGLE